MSRKYLGKRETEALTNKKVKLLGPAPSTERELDPLTEKKLEYIQRKNEEKAQSLTYHERFDNTVKALENAENPKKANKLLRRSREIIDSSLQELLGDDEPIEVNEEEPIEVSEEDFLELNSENENPLKQQKADTNPLKAGKEETKEIKKNLKAAKVQSKEIKKIASNINESVVLVIAAITAILVFISNK